MKKPWKIKTLNNYKTAQNSCIQIINEHETKSVEIRLTQISKSGGTNSKPFWNIAKKHKQNNLKDLYVIKEGRKKIVQWNGNKAIYCTILPAAVYYP